MNAFLPEQVAHAPSCQSMHDPGASNPHDLSPTLPDVRAPRQRSRILISAYACEPHLGSEPGAGWNTVRRMAEHHDLWVITRADHRPAIEAEMERVPLRGTTFIYHTLPFERGSAWYRKPAIYLHYYLWQVTLYFRIAPLHRQVRFTLAHHLNYARYWTPNTAALLHVPFVLGPVGSAESAPEGFTCDLALRPRLAEMLRNLARACAERDPLLRLTIRRSKVALATTPQTAAALRRLGSPVVRLCPDVGMTHAEMASLAALPAAPGPLRLLTVCRLIAWKGVHLGLRAFAQAEIVDAEYWIAGDGPERQRLEQQAHDLGIAKQVRFLGHIPRPEVLARLGQCHALVHPSLHDAGGWACVEAMAAGRPVLCLDWGGPGANVTQGTGWTVIPHSPEQTVRDMARIMRDMAADPVGVARFRAACHAHVSAKFGWPTRTQMLCDLYDEVRARTP